MPAPARTRPPAHDPTEKITFAEFGRREEWSEYKHEFHDGYAVPIQGPDAYPNSVETALGMSGTTPNHSRIAARANTALGTSLDGSPCEPFTSDLMIFVEAAGRGYYPDLSVVCGDVIPAEGQPRSATNPSLIIEVLGVSTEAFDRGEKRLHYMQLPTLDHLLLVDQYSVFVDHWFRDETGSWRGATFTDIEDVVALPSLDVELPLERLYRGIIFEPRPGR